MATKKQINDFLAMIVPIAQRQAIKHNNQIYASICIAQACHESGWGTSQKMVKANALFGIKVGNSAYHFGTAWKGKAYKTGTHEYYNGNKTYITDWFREYDSVEDATEDYFDMLCHCQRYKGALNQPTPRACIEGVIKGGYATGLNYVDHIMTIFNNYNLGQYDNGGSVAPAKPSYVVGKTYVTDVDLYVRSTPRGEKIPFAMLTDNAKKHGFSDAEGNGILKRGTQVTCKALTQTNGQTWFLCPSGWICAVNVGNKIYVK